MEKRLRLNLVLAALGMLGISAGLASRAQACPCGCSATNPDILYPGETMKVMLNLSRDQNFASIDDAGLQGEDGGPVARHSFTLGLARAITADLAFSVKLGAQQNVHPAERDDLGMADPSVGLRYVVARQSFVRSWLPEVHVFSSYKHPVAKSIYDSPDNARLMDVHGNGFAEMTAGLDLWFGMSEFKYGLTQTATWAFPRPFDGGDHSFEVAPGTRMRTTAAVGYNVISYGQVLVLVDREEQARQKVGGRVVGGSGTIAHGAGLAASLRTGARQTTAISLRRSAAFGENKNTTAATAVSVSFMQGV